MYSPNTDVHNVLNVRFEIKSIFVMNKHGDLTKLKKAYWESSIYPGKIEVLLNRFVAQQTYMEVLLNEQFGDRKKIGCIRKFNKFLFQ